MDSFERNYPHLGGLILPPRERLERQIQEGIVERNRILTTMDQAGFRAFLEKSGAGRISDEATLPAMHKARWHCPDLPAHLRLESGRWLLQHNFGDLYGHPVDLNKMPSGEVEL